MNSNIPILKELYKLLDSRSNISKKTNKMLLDNMMLHNEIDILKSDLEKLVSSRIKILLEAYKNTGNCKVINDSGHIRELNCRQTAYDRNHMSNVYSNIKSMAIWSFE